MRLCCWQSLPAGAGEARSGRPAEPAGRGQEASSRPPEAGVAERTSRTAAAPEVAGPSPPPCAPVQPGPPSAPSFSQVRISAALGNEWIVCYGFCACTRRLVPFDDVAQRPSLSPQRVDAAFVQLERLPLRDGAELPLWGLKAVAQALSDSLRADTAW
jgi:hypothetical protein